MDAPVSDFRPFKGLTKDVVKRIFGGGRTLKRGRKFAAEGYLKDMKITVGDGDAVVQGFCFASQTPGKKHKVFLAMDTSTYDCLEYRCSCTAGRGRCSHQCAVYLYLCAGAAFARSLDSEEREDRPRNSARQRSSETSDSGSLSCTSKPRTWGIPARRTEPEYPVEDIKFRKVEEPGPSGELKPFNPLPDAGAAAGHDGGRRSFAVEEDEETELSRRRKLKDRLVGEGKPMVLLRYFRAGDTSGEESEDPLEPEGESGAIHGSQYDKRRPRQLQYPPCLKTLLANINRHGPEQPTPGQVELWCLQLEEALQQSAAAAEQVREDTSLQASSQLWHTERVCRLTASNFGLICKRRPAFVKSLVAQMLYQDPPVAVAALHLGRSHEPVVVQKYIDKMRDDDTLVEVSPTGLHIHPRFGFLAASPDRLVTDSSCEPSDGLVEVKYLVSVDGPPELAIGTKANFCLHKTPEGCVRLNRRHNYYYQVQGQIACSGRSWCDFVCMSKSGELFVERIYPDESFWADCVTRLTAFFRTHFAPEIVYPVDSNAE